MNNKIKNLVISVGGNALSNDPKKDAVLLEPIAKIIVNNVKNGINVLLTTGNGPQSGELFDIINDANKTNSKHLLMKLDEANAMSQGYIGFHVMKAIYNELLANNLENKYSINCLETLTIVDENDVAWTQPTKPIGAFFKTIDEAKQQYPNDKIIEDAGRGYRKVVSSPKPIGFVGIEGIKKVLNSGCITITSIGGGIPCIIKNNKIISMEGIIDKDYSTALLANLICADLLLIVTAVDGVYIDYNTKNEKKIDKISTIELEKLISEYDFGKGSMEPKLKAAINFVNKTDNIAIITNINDVEDAIKFKKGTIIIK